MKREHFHRFVIGGGRNEVRGRPEIVARLSSVREGCVFYRVMVEGEGGVYAGKVCVTAVCGVRGVSEGSLSEGSEGSACMGSL